MKTQGALEDGHIALFGDGSPPTEIVEGALEGRRPSQARSLTFNDAPKFFQKKILDCLVYIGILEACQELAT